MEIHLRLCQFFYFLHLLQVSVWTHCYQPWTPCIFTPQHYFILNTCLTTHPLLVIVMSLLLDPSWNLFLLFFHPFTGPEPPPCSPNTPILFSAFAVSPAWKIISLRFLHDSHISFKFLLKYYILRKLFLTNFCKWAHFVTFSLPSCFMADN